MKKRHYSLYMVSNHADKPVTINFSQRMARMTIGVITLLLIAVIVTLIIAIPKIKSYDKIVAENQQLIRDRLKVTQILSDYNKIRQMDRYIRSVLGPDLKLTSLDSLGLDSSMTLSGIPFVSEDQPIEISYLDNIPIYPPVDGYITQGFSDDYLFTEDNHYGVDVAAPVGDPVKAAASGVVIFSNWTNKLGYTTIIYHSDDYFTIYGHCLRNIVSEHQYVSRGEVIGYVGNTGISAGPHLHFEIWREGTPIDPTTMIYSYRKSDISINNTGG